MGLSINPFPNSGDHFAFGRQCVMGIHIYPLISSVFLVPGIEISTSLISADGIRNIWLLNNRMTHTPGIFKIYVIHI